MDYSKGKIYKILNTITDDIYVGSTCVGLEKRFAKHKSQIHQKQNDNIKLYQKMRELGTDVFYIKLIQEAPSDSKAELRALEGKYIREIGTLNKHIAGRTQPVYIQETKDQKREYDKNYREEKQEHISERRRKHREDNQELYQERWRQTYLRRREKLMEQVKCECGKEVSRGWLSNHKKSQQHQQALENLNNINNVLLQTDN